METTIPGAPLFGRAAEQAVLERVLADARLGSSRAVVVSGEPGIGKTSLLSWVVDLGRSEGMEALSARGIESEAEVPFGGLLELLRPALDELERLPPAQADALRSALDLGPTAERDRFLIGAAVLNLLSVRSEQTPIVAVIDDAQWVDDASMTALLFASRRLLVDPVGVVFATRPEATGSLEAARLPQLPLSGVDSRAAGEIVGRHATTPTGPELIERIEVATGGNPLALVELARSTVDLDSWAVEGPLEVESSVTRAFSRRIADLPLQSRRMLALAAAEASGRLAWIEAAAAELQLDVTDLEPAEREALVSISFGTLTWRHPLVRSAAYAGISAGERREMHAALARALPDAAIDPRAWHLAAAALGADEAVAAELDAAGRRARSRSAYMAAATAAERAAQLSPGDENRARRLFAAAEAAWLGGRAGRAQLRLSEALPLAADPSLRAEIQHLRGQAMVLGGDVMAGYDVLVSGAELIATVDPDKAVIMLAEATDACVYAGRPAAMIAPARLAVELLPQAAHERERFFASLALGTALIYNGEGHDGARRLKEAVEILEGSDILSDEPRSLSAAALAPLWLREAGIGPSLIERAIEAARSQGAVGTLPFTLTLAAREAATTRRWSIGRALYEEAIGLARETDQGMPLCGALAGLAWLQGRLGEGEACEIAAKEALSLSESLGLGLFRIWALDALAELELGRGNLADAVPHLEAKRRTLADLEMVDPDLSPAPELVEAHVRDRRPSELEGILRPFAEGAEAKGQPWALGRLARSRGLLAGDDEFEPHFSEALRLHDATPDRFEAARSRLCFGERLRRAGQRVRAREQLRDALDAFDELGAKPWAERARVELLATGERARRRDPSTLDDLTPQELQISLVLTSGHTTREAAAKLFLSPKTVEYHLRNAYRKLGIHSREELARELSRMDLVPGTISPG